MKKRRFGEKQGKLTFLWYNFGKKERSLRRNGRTAITKIRGAIVFPEVVVWDPLCCVLILAREFYITTPLSKSLLFIVHLAELIHALSGVIFIWKKIKIFSNMTEQ